MLIAQVLAEDLTHNRNDGTQYKYCRLIAKMVNIGEIIVRLRRINYIDRAASYVCYSRKI